MPFSALTRCVAPFPPLPAFARGSGALPQPLDGCFPCRYGMLRRLRGCAHRSAVPAPHPAAFPRQHGASPRLGSVGVPYSWGVPLVFFYHTLCPEATPQIHPAMATNVMTSQTVEHVTHPSACAAPAASSAPCLWRLPVPLPPPRIRVVSADEFLLQEETGMICTGAPVQPGAGAWSRSTSSVTRGERQRRLPGGCHAPGPE